MALILDVVSLLPPEWRVTVTVVRGGGVDRFGKPVPRSEHTVSNCLIGEATTEEVEAFSEVASLDAVLSAPVMADFRSTDAVNSPKSAWAPARKWRVSGHPRFTPLGTKVPLSKEP